MGMSLGLKTRQEKKRFVIDWTRTIRRSASMTPVGFATVFVSLKRAFPSETRQVFRAVCEGLACSFKHCEGIKWSLWHLIERTRRKRHKFQNSQTSAMSWNRRKSVEFNSVDKLKGEWVVVVSQMLKTLTTLRRRFVTKFDTEIFITPNQLLSTLLPKGWPRSIEQKTYEWTSNCSSEKGDFAWTFSQEAELFSKTATLFFCWVVINTAYGCWSTCLQNDESEVE